MHGFNINTTKALRRWWYLAKNLNPYGLRVHPVHPVHMMDVYKEHGLVLSGHYFLRMSRNSPSSSCTLLLSQVPGTVMRDILSVLGTEEALKRDIELVNSLPTIRSSCPDLYLTLLGFIDAVSFKFMVNCDDTGRDPETGLLQTMKRRVEIIESFHRLENDHHYLMDSDSDDESSFSQLPSDLVELVLMEVLSTSIKTDIDLLKILPFVKRHLPSLHKSFVDVVDPVRNDEVCMDDLRSLSDAELISFMKEHGVHTSARYSRDILLKECAREFERDCTGLRRCHVEAIHMAHILSDKTSNVYRSVVAVPTNRYNKSSGGSCSTNYLCAMRMCMRMSIAN